MIMCQFEDGKRANLRHTVITGLIINDDKILLVKRASNLLNEANKWALPGGYLDRDETVEVGVKREIREESGYETRDLVLFLINSNPNRPAEDRQNVDMVFMGKATDKVNKPDNEVSDVIWCSFSQLPHEADIAFDHHMIISHYIKYRQKPFSLPILI